MLDYTTKKVFLSNSTSERDYSVDIVRCVSCFMVIAGHTFWFVSPASGFCSMEAGTTEHFLSMFMRCVFTSGTDIFLMISGVFFLAPERNLKTRKIWGKNILKMACAYILWMILYSLVDLLYLGKPFTFSEVLHHAVLQDQRHLWYIPMMLGVYMIVPLLRVFTEHAKQFHYKYLFIIVGIVSVLNFWVAFSKAFTYTGAEESVIIIYRLPVGLFSNYFILSIFGHWYYTYRLNKSSRVMIYILALLGVLSMYLCCVLNYNLNGVPDSEDLIGKLVFGNIFKCSAIFILFTVKFENIKPGKWGKIFLSRLSNATLFIYLIHWMLIEFMVRNQFLMNGALEDHMIFIGFIYVFIAYAISALFSILFLQKIPWIRMRNAVLDRLFPNRTIYVTKNH